MSPKKNADDFLEVLRNLAHTLSQPLTSLRGSVEIALMGEMNEWECRQVLELALQESQRMAATLETLRELVETEASNDEAQPVSWTRSVEKSLENAAVVQRSRGPQLLSSVEEEVWVKGIPQHLDMATRRIIKAVVESGHRKHVVRVKLSVRGQTACLSVCAESLAHDVESVPQRQRTNLQPGVPEPGNLDWWLIRRAIERQGGRLKIDELSETCRCYRVSLPLAPLKVRQQP